jgi:hypothetical protein
MYQIWVSPVWLLYQTISDFFITILLVFLAHEIVKSEP